MSTTLKDQTTTSFRFLDLPPELRLMVYERIPVITRHHTFTTPEEDARDSRISLVVKLLPVALLATSKQLKHEATPIFAPKLANLRNEPMRIIIDTPLFDVLFGSFDLMYCRIPRSPAEIQRELTTNRDRVAGKDVAALLRFLTKCDSYVRQRAPQSSVMAFTRHPACDLRQLLADFYPVFCVPWGALPGPTGFMLRAAATDDVEDPPSSSWPQGRQRGIFRNYATHVGGYDPDRHYVEDVGEEEWEEVWGEGEQYFE